MKYAILLRDKQKDALQIKEYCTVSAFNVDETMVFEDVTNVCRHFKSNDKVIISNIATLGQLYEEKGIQDNLLKAGLLRRAQSYKQEYLDLPKEKIKTLLKSSKGVLQIFELLDCSCRTLYRYMKKHTELQNG